MREFVKHESNPRIDMVYFARHVMVVYDQTRGIRKK